MNKGTIATRIIACVCSECFNFNFSGCVKKIKTESHKLKDAENDEVAENFDHDVEEGTMNNVSTGDFVAVVYEDDWYPGN